MCSLRVQEDNTQAGFVPYARAIMAHLGAHYRCSAADLIAVVAAYGSTALGSGIDAAHDNRNQAQLYVRSSACRDVV